MSSRTRSILDLLFGLYALLGLILFVSPADATAHFAWKISPFVAMTIGGWCLGTAWAAAFVRIRPPETTAGPVVYLGLFGLGETIVLIAFFPLISAGSVLAWLYIIAVATALIFGISAGIDRLQALTPTLAIGARAGPATVAIIVVFVIAVGLLAGYVLTRPAVAYAVVFPEPMSLFSLRSFGALYAAIALGTAWLLVSRNMLAILTHAIAMYGLIVFITVAALWFIERFDFRTYPLQWIYIAAYVLVGVVAGLILLARGTGRLPERSRQPALR